MKPRYWNARAWIILWTALLVIIAIIMTLWTHTTAASESFDHTECQYPVRSSNPTNGCDNSDPAEPEKAVKGESTQTPSSSVPVSQPEEEAPLPVLQGK